MGVFEDFFEKSVENIQVSLQPDKSNSHFMGGFEDFSRNLSKIFKFHYNLTKVTATLWAYLRIFRKICREFSCFIKI